ncbi:outer membrane lipoprotein carrier protein LolA [Dyadobacter luteus]|uniref:Outer membrane lipoprotein carrier protein LolA n=1 Tax=Dyadobacter luteus TaxID=2259619 RepID=A0A3D8Y951_9BACT|nr:outer membrane lipoprotein carrier protein LolA [Dyadobacter luteus]REA59430.1 outer membrane lipoprotein carrier protein LolA [Dyadobacter luteus]
MQKVSCLLFLVLSIWVNAHAQTFKPVSDPSKVLAALKKSSESATSVQADFEEEKTMAVLKEPQRSSGVFYYRKNDKMRWEQQKPTKYIILIDGDKLRVQENGKEKNVGQAGRMAAQIRNLMLGLVNGNFQNSKDFSQTVSESTSAYQISLTPLNKRVKGMYKQIDLVFSKNNLRLKDLTFYQKDGDKSVMKFTNEKVNQPITDRIFSEL